jgi:CHAT domain-containing protein
MDLERSGDLARYRYILLSAHGIANTNNPWHSAIVLSQNGGGQEDGFITAAEWQGMHLRSDLTVLAACETGLGPVHRGEGLLGLPYAFTLAGTANVAQTLWSVGDRATAETVTNLFQRLSEGQNPSQALTLAKRDALKQYGGNQPYYWAPLVIYGY